jgi:uncharacterized protein (TIGR03066 family)
MTPLTALFLALLAPADAPKGAKLAEAIVGVWQGVLKVDGKEMTLTVEFLKDGSLKGGIKDGDQVKEFAGKYRVLGDDAMETSIKSGDQEETETMKVVVEKDRLTLTNSRKTTVAFTRVKPRG